MIVNSKESIWKRQVQEFALRYKNMPIETVSRMGDVPLASLLAERQEVAWEHEGLCSECNGKTYLFPECMKCLKKRSETDGTRVVMRQWAPCLRKPGLSKTRGFWPIAVLKYVR